MKKIIINLDVMLAKRKMSLSELAERIGISIVNLSILKTGKAKGIRFETLRKICMALNCKPGDIIDMEEVTEKPEKYSSVTPSELISSKE